MSITIRPATFADQPAITSIILQIGFNPLNLHWQNFIVAQDQGQIVGVAQIKTHKDGSRELASVAVVPSRQQQGIGYQLVQALLDRVNGELYLFCFPALESYYGEFGFQKVKSDELPGELTRALRTKNLLAAAMSCLRFRRVDRFVVMKKI